MARLLATLERKHSPLAPASAQRELLASVPATRDFDGSLRSAGLGELRSARIDVLQVNLGKRCNQTCRHCHVDAGPDRKEVMPRAVMEAALALLERERIATLDITGGAPELHPDFRELIERASAIGTKVMHRCNLTAILLPNYADIPALLARHRVEVVASLPYFRAGETDTQRGDGVFDQSIRALRLLNDLGYGKGGDLCLTLVTNPVGTFLPSDQRALEVLWKREMRRLYEVEFDRLFAITNMPISRFLEFLEERGRTTAYLERLAGAFNPSAVAGVMCRSTLSVGWDGTLYDCDFNQMLEMPVTEGRPRSIFDASRASLEGRVIATGPHCYGCTAGAGSSCGGAVA